MVQKRVPAIVALLMLVPLGCGGDEEPPTSAEGSTSTGTTSPPPSTRPATSTVGSTSPRESTSSGESGGAATPKAEEERDTGGSAPPSAEQQEGGAGDEEAASTAVALVGRDGRIRPARVEVPPYIAVRVSLRAADARSYTLSVRGRTLQAGDALTLDGLAPDARHVLRSPSGGGRVVIVPSSEPAR